MPIQLTCPNCNRPLRVPDELIGRKVKCTNCQTVFVASTGDEPAPPTESIQSEEAPSRPSSRRERPRDDDYDDDRRDDDRYDDEPRRRSSRRGSYERAHRGGMILTFGILALLGGIGSCVGVFCCFFWVSPLVSLPFGIMAWVMGHGDLKEMRSGRMDPSGKGTTQTGYYMGIAAVILTAIDIVLSVISAIFGLAMQAAR